MSPRRTLICTLTALTSGIFGAYLGGQMSVSAQNRACETQSWGPKLVCQTATVPGAIWQGSLTGLGTGAILGAFLAGIATRKTAVTPTLRAHSQDQQATGKTEPTAPIASDPATSATPAALTSLQTEVLYCLLALLTAKQVGSETTSAEAISAEAVSTEAESATTPPTSSGLTELRSWAETMARSQPDVYDITRLPDLQSVTVTEGRQLLVEAGFSVQAVDQAWQLLEIASPMPPLN